MTTSVLATLPAPVGTGARLRLVARRLRRDRPAVAGLLGLTLLAMLCVVGPQLAAWGYAEVDPTAFLAAPDSTHWWGTTQAGRDVFALTVEGLRTSLLVGFGAGLLQTAIAATVGTFAAYRGGWLDRVATWLIDLLLVVPSFFLVAILSVRAGGEAGSVWLLVMLLGALGWMLSARVVRAMTLSLRELDYVTAARYMNVPTRTIVSRHILPNLSSLLVVDATLAVAAAVLAETSLSFFGFGVQAPETSLGTLIAEGQRTATTYPWIFLAPAGALVALLVCVNLVGDGLRDALDPSRGGRA
ncbi:ABC transporter permease [Georgenia yuyongxinii]|uniref:Oligopeptide transport system permease protein OppC n=1 Tax=Georgenia yuyongxinii TaxID=2589797 RepID=A0A552WPG2_9MICO|nr:ABC transporter permease [Georgenia yuyongxinii]TRW44666.1 ABC transporter permease [Georgenia yuyongxinii]